MSRLFGGSTSEVAWSIGSVVGTGAWTFAMVVKFNAGVSWQGLLNLESSGTHRVGTERHGTGGDFATITGGGANTKQSGLSISSSDGWMLLAAARAAGNNKLARFTKYPIGGTASHADAPSPGQDNQAASNTIIFGNTENADFFAGRCAAVAVWDTALNDAQMESLVTTFTRANWLSLSPHFLADELDAFATDYAGTSTRSALTDTSDDADDPTGWASWAGAAASSLVYKPRPLAHLFAR